jgi:hypothetical protein
MRKSDGVSAAQSKKFFGSSTANSDPVSRIADISSFFLLKFESIEFFLGSFNLGDSRGTEYFVTNNVRSTGGWKAVSFH